MRSVLLAATWATAWLTASGAEDGRPASEGAPPAASAKPPADLDRRFDALAARLDAPEFAVRQEASRQLQELAADPKTAAALAPRAGKLLLSPALSLEARRRLEMLAARLPKPAAEALPAASPEEIQALIAELEAASYATRLGAGRQLERLLDNPRLVWPILRAVKARLGDAGLSADARRWLRTLHARARTAWLNGAIGEGGPPPLGDDRAGRLLDELLHPTSSAEAARRSAQEAAEEEFREGLVRDEDVPRLRRLMETRLHAPGADPYGAGLLEELIETCRPAMVAEYWQRGSHEASQHLYVGVPSLGPGAQRPSHFDRIDDRTAHCASGQNLQPGDYPVGVAIPHPSVSGEFFRLVNLSTPRRQLAYAYELEVPMKNRLADLTGRTLEWLIARRKPLSSAELDVLRGLDGHALSQAAGRLLAAIDDVWEVPAKSADGPRYIPPAERAAAERLGSPSHHGQICTILAERGTPAAVPGLLEAIRAARLLKPRAEAPYRLDCAAVLAIAARDAGAEDVLAALLDRDEPVAEGEGGAATVEATAAGLLLRGAGQDPGFFGLLSIHDPVLARYGLVGYRFSGEPARKQFRQWQAQRPRAAQP